jgi:hypothetical protein
MWVLLVAGLLATLVGCGASSSKPAVKASADDATSAEAPQLIVALTAETKVFECLECGMMFDRDGECSMGCAPLEEMNVAYVCSADGKPVGAAGRCPRCGADARVVRTPAQGQLPSTVTGQ